MNDPPPLGSSLRIEMELPSDHFRCFARVMDTKREDDSQAPEPRGIGLAFFGSDGDAERILRKAVKELESRYPPRARRRAGDASGGSRCLSPSRRWVLWPPTRTGSASPAFASPAAGGAPSR
jgi:hypothetical protein